MEFVPGGDFLFSSSNDQSVKMWDITTGFCVQTLKGHTDFVKKVAVNLTGSLMASSSKDQSIIIWNMSQIRGSNASKDAIISVLREHDHIIDSVKWAPPESCKTIETSDYNKSQI